MEIAYLPGEIALVEDVVEVLHKRLQNANDNVIREYPGGTGIQEANGVTGGRQTGMDILAFQFEYHRLVVLVGPPEYKGYHPTLYGQLAVKVRSSVRSSGGSGRAVELASDWKILVNRMFSARSSESASR